MRGLKSTLVLVVVLAGLVAYIFFVDRKKPASGAPEVKAKAFTVDADQIEEIQIKPASGEASRVEKTNGSWQLVEPEKTYVMKPGDAHLYDIGAVHSPKRDGLTKLVRIEGANLDRIKRSNIKAAAPAKVAAE